MKNRSIQIRVNAALKKKLERVLDKMGLDMPTAVRIYFAKIVMTGGIPFSLENNEEDRYSPAQMKAIDRAAARAKKGIGVSRSFSSVDDMIEDLRA